MRKLAKQIPGRRAFQAEITRRAKSFQQESVVFVEQEGSQCEGGRVSYTELSKRAETGNGGWGAQIRLSPVGNPAGV